MNLGYYGSGQESETFGQDASFKLEQTVGAMSISPSGRDVVLASKEGLHIIDLDSPYSPPRYLPHRTPWEVADVQWSPFANRDHWIVSTSNQKAIVWDVGAPSWRDTVQSVLHGHTRAITDINFSAHHPDILATCAVDSFVHCWDLRVPLRPAYSFSDWFAGATQVKWSRQDEHVLASSHDKFLHIWDDRKGAYPVRTIEAHHTKIYGIDWNRFEPGRIVTCSLDKTIKFWNTNTSDDIPERTIETPFPVWRARHTPFGWGLMVMPQRGNNDLHLYDRRSIGGKLESGKVQPVDTFPGHKGQVKEFLWRASGSVSDGTDHRDFQLVSWGADSELRLHRIATETLEDVGYRKGVTKTQRLNFTRRNAKYRTFRDEFQETFPGHDMPGRMDSISTTNLMNIRSRASMNPAMCKVAVAQFRGWLQGERRERRIGMHGKGSTRHDMDPITWMKNVKIASWETETLGDEIAQFGQKFSKVEFDYLDINHRRAVISLHSPWGEDGASVYTRVDFRFPKAYPREARASVHLQNSSMISSAVSQKLSEEMKRISEAFASKGRGCIEAIVRYLLREQSEAEIISWILGDPMTGSKVLDASATLDDGSSDSDDDPVNGLSSVLQSSANARVPLAKGCGALWSQTGKLVCFFVPKPVEPVAFLSNTGSGGLTDSQSSNLFVKFGNALPKSPLRKSKAGTNATIDDTLYDDSDSSSEISTNSSSASSSSSSSESVSNLRSSRLPFREIQFDLHKHSRSVDGSNKSTTMGGTKAGDGSRGHFISIHHDFEDLIPAKKSLALRYRILGNVPEVCAHNAKVAEEAALSDLASIWMLASMIVQGQIPLEIERLTRKGTEDIVLVARQASLSLKRKDSGVDLGQLLQSEAAQQVYGHLRWGNHPLGAGYLIPAMFAYFERLADVQMLAMLSCIFAHADIDRFKYLSETEMRDSSEIITTNQYFSSTDTALSILKSSNVHSHKPLSASVVRPPFLNQNAMGNTTLQFWRTSPTATTMTPIVTSTHVGNGSNPSRAPSVVAQNPSGEVSAIHSTAVSLSASPNESRFGGQSNSTAAFPISRASLSALTQSHSTSPPSNTSNSIATNSKKPSPSSSLTPATWTSHGAYGGQSAANSRIPKSFSEAGDTVRDGLHSSRARSLFLAGIHPSQRKEENQVFDTSRGSVKSVLKRSSTVQPNPEKKSRKKLMTTVSLRNQDQFDLDNRAIVPLLEAKSRWKYEAYRSSYLELLEVWQLWIQRAELVQTERNNPLNVGQSRKRTMSVAHTTTVAPGLQMRCSCPRCSKSLDPIEKNGLARGWQCVDKHCGIIPGKAPKSQSCSICEKTIQKLAVPCLECGHLTCYDCAKDWFDPDTQKLVSTKQRATQKSASRQVDEILEEDITSEYPIEFRTCPTGCGCPCPTLTTINVPTPPTTIIDSLSTQQGLQPLVRAESHQSHRSNNSITHSFRLISEHRDMPDKAMSALLSLGTSRTRSVSTANASSAITSSHPGSDMEGNASGIANSNTHPSDAYQYHHYPSVDELVPWSRYRVSNLGRGVGAGLSRGLSSKGSDSTIRKI